jgi:hypothetical protein
MCSMSAGTAHAAFRRALDRRHLAQALAAAHNLPVISLADALELVLLAADRDLPTPTTGPPPAGSPVTASNIAASTLPRPASPTQR